MRVREGGLYLIKIYLSHLVLFSFPGHLFRVERILARADENRLPPVMRIFPFGDDQRSNSAWIRPDQPSGESGKSLAVRTEESAKDPSYLVVVVGILFERTL